MTIDELRALPGVLSVGERDDGGVGVRVERDTTDAAGSAEFEAVGFEVRRTVTLAYSNGYILDPVVGR